MDQKKREKKLITNTLILSIGTIFSSIFSFFVVPLYSRWLSASEYGTYDLFVTYISLLMPVITLSCGEGCFRFLLERKLADDKKKICCDSILISVVGILVGLMGVAIFFVIGKQEYLLPFVVLLVGNTLFSQCGYIARGFRKPEVYTFSNIIYLISMVIFVTLFVYFKGMGVTGILYGAAVGYFCGVIFSVITSGLLKYIRYPVFDRQLMKDLIYYSVPLIPNTISWWVVGVSDRTLVSIFLGTAANGVYSIASKLPSLCTTVFGVFHMSWQESASDAINDADRNEYFNDILNRIIPFCLCICMCVLSINRYMYRWIWDSKYIGGYYQVSILITASAISFFGQFLGGVLVALKKTKINGSTTVIAAIVNVLVNFLLIRSIGLYAASFSTLVAYIVLLVLRIYLIRSDYLIRITRKSILSILFYSLVIFSQFSDNELIGVLSVVYSVIVSLCLNRDILQSFFNKVVKR